MASSNELKDERIKFGDFIRSLDGTFEKYGYRIRLIKWEDLPEGYDGRPKQDEYNDEVGKCDIFVSLFYTKAGEFTIEEYEVAKSAQKQNGKPTICVYCRELTDGQAEDKSLTEFKTRLKNEIRHYWAKYQNSDSLQLKFVMELLKTNDLHIGDLKTENGTVMLRESQIANMDKLRFAADNEDYRRMVNRLSELAPLIEKPRSRVEKYPDDEDFVSDLQKLLNERNKLEDDFDQYQQILLDTAKRISLLHGERITDRMRRAMEAFDVGKVREANVILEEAEKDADRNLSDYKKSREITEQNRQNVISSIEELLLKTSTIMSDATIAIDDRISQTTELYAKADSMAKDIDYDKGKYGQLLYAYETFLSKYGKYNESVAICLRLIPMADELYGAESAEAATVYHGLGFLYLVLSDYDKAMDYLLKALKIRQKVYSEEHRDTAASYNNIGKVYGKLGNYDKALVFFNKSLKIREKIFGEEHSDTASSYNNIGSVYYCLGDYYKALEYYAKALKIREKILGDEHSDTAACYNNIGRVYGRLGNYDKALVFYNKALKIKEKILGEVHPYTATSYNCIGNVYVSLGNYDKALEYFNNALKIREKIFGEEHPNTATSYNDIGNVYGRLGDYSKALEYYNKALNIIEKIFGKEHSKTQALKKKIELVKEKMGEKK